MRDSFCLSVPEAVLRAFTYNGNPAASCALCGRVGRDQFGMLCFERFEFVVEAVIFGVGDDRAAEDVVAIDVEVELFAQFGGAGGGVLRHKIPSEKIQRKGAKEQRN